MSMQINTKQGQQQMIRPSTAYLKAFVNYITALLYDPSADIEQFEVLPFLIPNDANLNQQKVYQSMINLLDKIEKEDGYMSFSLKHKFFTYNVEQLFLHYAPDYKVFWELVKPDYFREVAGTFELNFEFFNYNDKLDAARYAV